MVPETPVAVTQSKHYRSPSYHCSRPPARPLAIPVLVLCYFGNKFDNNIRDDLN